jgi:hypothetical protein
MIRRLPAAWLCLLLSTPVLAAQAPSVVPPDTPSAANGTLRLLTRPNVEVSVGGVRIEIEKTTLEQIHKALGGTIAQRGEEEEATFGLCYLTHLGDRRARLWLLSERVAGADHPIDSALVAPEATGQPTPPNCSEVKGPTSVKVNDTSVGTSMSELEARLGKGRKQKGGWLGFTYKARAGSGGLTQLLFVAVAPYQDAVSDLYFGQTTAQVPSGEGDDD